MSATARSVNLALQEPRSVLIRQPAGATPTTVESPTLATHYHTPDIHRSAAQIIRPYARSVRKTGLERRRTRDGITRQPCRQSLPRTRSRNVLGAACGFVLRRLRRGFPAG